ncbi:MAG TPA: phasin family protein [Ramlibacter sp.]|nr:phasin family protein [Ramlibacter sp.]
MASRNSTRATHARATHETLAEEGQDMATGMARQNMAWFGQMAAAMFSAAEVLQTAQQQMAERTASLTRQTAQQLRQATGPGDLMAIQASLLSSGVQEFLQYAQGLMKASMTMQGELMKPTGEGEQAAEQAAGNLADMANMAAPMLHAWQAMFTAPNGAAQRPH